MTGRELQAILAYRLGLAKYLFIHIPKNAGVAVRKSPELSWKMVSADPYFHVSRAYTRELKAYMDARGEHHGYQHARWRDIDPAVWKRLRPVAVIRNPWARVVSRYRFARFAAQHQSEYATTEATSFEAFVEERHEFGGLPFYWHRAIRGWYPQVDYVTDEAGTLRVDLLRQESLGQDAMRYFGMKAPVAKRNTSRDGSDYRDYYTSKTLRIVADWYKADIDAFGFDFDSGATRGTVYGD
ncbi:MAG: hypothetical protein KDK24_14985 [Pseudooceanicola sp.]|nr:hypothetical protein [Pseudooceanicola sp.]